MLSHIILADGPSSSSSFRPNDDTNQWWARRDALVRITNTACYLSPHTPHPCTNELFIVFNEVSMANNSGNETNKSEDDRMESNSQSKGEIAVAAMAPKAFVAAVPVPTESQVVRAWRQAFAKLEKTKETFILNKNDQGGVLCGRAVYAEALPLLTASPSPHTESEGATSSMQMPNIDALDKKQVLALLQSSCSMDFLRKHALNASEKIVLKKMNKDKLVTVLREWISTQNNNNAASTVSTEERGEKAREEHEDEFDKLFRSFLVILSRCVRATHSPRTDSSLSKKRSFSLMTEDSSQAAAQTTLLLLHEDYPQELPVFGQTRSLSAEDARHHVICALGGVRDASDVEIRALVAAAERLGIRCVGANLGRTAEFTSKIIAAMGAHALSGRLIPAVKTLPAVSLSQGVILPKLLSIRKGHETWDGHKKLSSSSSTSAPATHVTAPMSLSSGRPCLIHALAAAKMTTRALFDTDERSALPRERLHALVQLVVNTLWKSRMASESAEQDEETATTPSVDCCLSLCFADNVMLTLDRGVIAKQVARLHMAAPSEFQILSMLRACLSDASLTRTLSCGEKDNVLVEALSHVLPRLNHRRDRKVHLENSMLLRLQGVCDVFSVTATAHSAGTVRVVDSLSMSDIAYSEKCGCAEHSIASADSVSEKKNVYVVLGEVSSCVSVQQEKSLWASALYQWRHHENAREVHESDKVAERMQYLEKLVYVGNMYDIDKSLSLSPALAITMLQHFAYHNRLF